MDVAEIRPGVINSVAELYAGDGLEFSNKVAYDMGCPEFAFIQMASLGVMLDVMRTQTNLTAPQARDFVNNIVDCGDCCLCENVVIILAPEQVSVDYDDVQVFSDVVVSIGDALSIVEPNPYIPSSVVVSLASESVQIPEPGIFVQAPQETAFQIVGGEYASVAEPGVLVST